MVNEALPLSRRCDTLDPFLVMDVVRDAAALPDAIHFEIGQPDLPPAPGVLEAIRRFDGHVPCTESLGLRALREKIAGHYRQHYGLTVDPGRIALTQGSSGAFMLAYALLLDAGQTLALSDPGYPCYRNLARMLDIHPLPIAVDASTDYRITPEMLSGHRVHALHIASPVNPTGSVYGDADLQALCAYCQQQQIPLIADELYHGLTYGAPLQSALAFSEEAIVISGFSKYFCLPGFRLGWIILPESMMRKAEILLQNMRIAPATLSQIAALQAFDGDYLAQIRTTFQERRDYLCAALSPLFDIPVKPSGAFYLWADISRYSDDSLAFTRTLLKQSHVAVTPGVDFGDNGTRHFVRFAFTRHLAHLQEGVRRMEQLLT